MRANVGAWKQIASEWPLICKPSGVERGDEGWRTFRSSAATCTANYAVT